MLFYVQQINHSTYFESVRVVIFYCGSSVKVVMKICMMYIYLIIFYFIYYSTLIIYVKMKNIVFSWSICRKMHKRLIAICFIIIHKLRHEKVQLFHLFNIHFYAMYLFRVFLSRNLRVACDDLEEA